MLDMTPLGQEWAALKKALVNGRVKTLLWIALFVAIGLALLPLRFDIVSTWHAPSGDGLDYYSLSQELRRSGRFAYGPPPLPYSFARLPGYPLFLSHVVVRQAPLPLDAHLRRATQANVILDALTAILVVLILRELRLGLRLPISRVAQVATFVVALGYPLLVLLSSYGLADTLATFLSTLELFLALRAMRTRLFLHAFLCGVVAGAAQLVRLDALVMAPAAVAAIFCAQTTLRRRLLAITLFLQAATMVFLPWPLRNYARFGSPHPTGGYLRVRGDGQPMPGGIIFWVSTWATGASGETYLDLIFTLRRPLGWEHVPRTACDNLEECAETTRILDLYNHEGLSPRVNDEFVKLAYQRIARHPWRTFVTLPLRRLPNLWTPLPEVELPMRVPRLELPERRWLFGRCDRGLYWLAACGALLLLLRPGGRRLVLFVGLAIVGRSALYCYAVPNAVNQRYVVEAFPLLFVLATGGLSTMFAYMRKSPAPVTSPAQTVTAGPRRDEARTRLSDSFPSA